MGIDVLDFLDKLVARHRGLMSSDAYAAQELSKATYAYNVVSELVEAAEQMNALAKGPVGGVSQADKRAVIARMNAALKSVKGE